MLCKQIKVNRSFGETYRLNLHADFLLGLLLNLQDGGDMFLQNVGRLSSDYTVLYTKTQNSS
jgi:hypothetical protein